MVSPDWLIDSIEAGTLPEEKEYHPRGRGCGDHTHKTREEVSQCNGDILEGRRSTTGETRESQNGTTGDQTIPQPATNRPGEEEGRGVRGEGEVGAGEEMEVDGDSVPISETAPLISSGETSNGAIGSPAGERERVEREMVERERGGGEERLLTGLIFHLTGYLECMEPDTLSKWKEVSLPLPPSPSFSALPTGDSSAWRGRG